MKLQQIILAQCIWFSSEVEPEDKTRRSPVPIVRAMEDRYGFVQVPRTVQEFNFQTGVTFLRGYFNGVVIDKFQLYEKGLLCESSTVNSDICDEFLHDLTNWAIPKFNLPIVVSGPRSYFSQLEVSTDRNIGSVLNRLAPVGEVIGDCLVNYGRTRKNFEASGIRLHADFSLPGEPPAPDFVFDRRASKPYEEGIYFSSAPLRTDDHLVVLNELEKLL